MSTYPSTHHPDWSARRAVITEGYTQCGGRILPPLARESREQAAKGDGSKDDGRSATAAPGRLRDDKDCRNGRACVSGRCAARPCAGTAARTPTAPSRRSATRAGSAAAPGGQARAQAQAEDEPAKPPGPMLAALQEQRPRRAPPAAKDVTACQRSCDDVRNQCVEAAPGEATSATPRSRPRPNYRACACPNYPAGTSAVTSFCTSAYERGKSCTAATQRRNARAKAIAAARSASSVPCADSARRRAQTGA